MFKNILKHPLTYILSFSLIIRLIMINYGLPLWLYNDEPPYILGALKMLQLKTILPVLHEQEFISFLYYPPYICYLFLPFFVLVASISIITFDGSMADYISYVASDPSIFFLTGRFVIILISLLSIYFIYRVTKNIFGEEKLALLSAFLVSTSLIHILLSVTSKQWMPIFFIYVLGLYFLSNKNLSVNKRFIYSSIVTGIGTGISTITILFVIVMFFWYIFVEDKRLKELLTGSLFYKVSIILITLSILPAIIYPASFGFAPDMTIDRSKDMYGVITSPLFFNLRLLRTEPVIFILFLIGLFSGFKKNKPFYIVSISFIYLYSIIFYIFFRFEYRFLMPIIVFLCIGASYGYNILQYKMSKRSSLFILITVVIFSLATSIRISYLGYVNDSRVLVKEWMDANTKPDTKVIVYANLMRLPNSIEGINEQYFIDPNSLRTNDKNEKVLDKKLRFGNVYHALNLYTVKNENFYNSIVDYAKNNNYEYLIISKQDFLNDQSQFKKMRKLTENAILLDKFGNNERDYSLGKTEIGPTLLPLFKINEFGPEIEIYKITIKN